MGRRRQVSDRQISAAAREVFLDRGPKAPVAMVAKHIHAYMQHQPLSSQQHRDYIRAMLDVVFPDR